MASNRIKGITIEIGGDTTKLVDALKGVDRQINVAKSSLTDINKLLKFDTTSTELITQKQKYLEQEIQAVVDRLTQLHDAQSDVDEGSKKWDDLQREIIETEHNLDTLYNELVTFQSELEKEAKAKALKEVNDQCETMKTRLSDINKLLQVDPTNVALLSQKATDLRNSLDAAKTKLEELQRQQSEVARGSAEWDTLQHEIVETEAEIKNLTKEYEKFSDVSTQQILAVTKKMEGIGKNVSQVGKDITKGVTVPIMTGFTASAKAAVDWESAFTGVMKTVDETANTTYEDLATAIGEMATRTASSREEIARVMEIAGQLGVSADYITDFTEVMVKLGDTTNLSADMAADSIAKFANVTGMSLGDVDQLGAALVDLGNNFATTEEDIMLMATRLSAAGSQVGMTEADILGFATALSSVGIKAEMGGSAFSKAIIKMQVAAETGFEQVIDLENRTGMSLRDLQMMSQNSSKDFKELADSLGMTKTELQNVVTAGTNLNSFADVANMKTEDFVRLYRDDATAAMQAFINGLGDTESHGETTIAMLQEMGFTEVRLRDTLTRLANSQDLVNTAVAQSTQAWNENSAMNVEAQKRYETMSARLSQTKERLKNVAIEIGNNLYPHIDKLITIIEKATTWFGNLDEKQQKTIVTIGLVVAAIGPAILTVGTMIEKLAVVTGAFTKLSALLGFAGPGGLLAAMALVVAAGVAIYQNWDTIVEKCQWFKEKIIGIWQSIKDFFAHPIQAIVNFASSGSIQGYDGNVQAYASAYHNPVLFKHPTVLQTPYGQKQFGDGNGAEVVMGLNKLRELVGSAGNEITNNITIYAQPNQNVNQLADVVIRKITAMEERAALGAL